MLPEQVEMQQLAMNGCSRDARQVCHYNFSKISGAQKSAAQQAAAKPRGGGAGGVSNAEEGLPLVERRNGDARH